MKVSGRHCTGRQAAFAVSLFIILNLLSHPSWGQEKSRKPNQQTSAAQPAPKPADRKETAPSQAQSAPPAIDFEMEMKKIEALIRVNEKNAEAYYNRGCLYELKGDPQKAAEDYSRAIELDKRLRDALYNRGLLFSKMKKYEEALRDFSELIKLEPAASDALCSRGSVYFQMGKMDLALSDYSSGLKITPGDADLLYNRAVVYLEKGEKEAAAQDLKKSAGLYHDKTRKEFPELAPQSAAELKKAALEGRVAEFVDYMPEELGKRVQGFEATRSKVEKAMLDLEGKTKQLLAEKVRREGNTLAFSIVGTDPRWGEVFGPKWPEIIKQNPKEPRFFYITGEFGWKEEIQVVQQLQACLENPSFCKESTPPNSALQLKRIGGIWKIVDGKKAEDWKQVQALGEGLVEILQWAGKFLSEKKGKMPDEEMLINLAREYTQKLMAFSAKKRSA